MHERVPTTHGVAEPTARFALAPPRRFVLPAILLLLSERPGYGYGLEKDLQEFHFGHIDRPTVYRALAQLEADGFVESWSQAAKAGSSRRVYGITDLGERVLRSWMSVVKEERDSLERVLKRYQATGRVDALLAEVEGGWGAPLRWGESPVSSTAPVRRPLSSSAPGGGAALRVAPVGRSAPPRAPDGVRHHCLIADRSVALIEVRSTVGPISFGALGLTGTIDVELTGDEIRAGTQPTAHLEVAVDGLRSGNNVYDAELLRRIGARRFPRATVDLRECVPIGSAHRYRLAGELTFHGVTRMTHGSVQITVTPEHHLVVTGEQVFDIRDFNVPSPTVLMFRIYPDVRVRLHAEAELVEV
jgi:DNA-binding PadR family transcriptional regulator